MRRRRRWFPALGAAVLAVAVLATVLIVNRPGTGAAPQAPQPPADALPSGAPITERTLVGAAPDAGSRPVVAELEGTPVLVVTRSFEITVLDMATGEPIGEPIEGFGVMAATAARVDGRSVVITGSVDRVIRLWDLATGEPLATTLTGHTDTVTALAVTEVDDRTVLLSGSDDKTIRRWDLATAAPIGAPLTGMTSGVTILSVIRTGGRPVVLATAFDSPVLSWDIAHGTALGPPIPNVYNTITAVELPGGLAVLSHPDHLDTEVVDVRTGAPLDGYPSGLKTSTPPIASVVVAGRPLLFDTEIEAIKIRDLRTGEPVGSPLTGHEGMIRSLTPVTVGGSTYLVSSSSDRTIRIWDLTARAGG